MLKIKSENVISVGHQFDYELEDGTLLHEREWNGEVYAVVEKKGYEKTYRPVYKEVEEGEFKIIGFEE